MIAEVTPQLWWYVARASGLVAYALAALSVALGLSFSARLVRRKGAPAWLNDAHRFLGALTVAFTAVHLTGLWADTYVHFGPTELFVPMASTWQPGAVAWGVVALYLLVAIELTSLAMRRLNRRFWHSVHITSIAMFLLATMHALVAGTDTTSRTAAWLALGTTAAITFLILYRLLTRRGAGVSKGRNARVRELVDAA